MFHASDDSVDAGRDGIDLAKSDRHRVLAVERRRVLLDVLAGRTPPINLRDLATAVAEQEHGMASPDDGTVTSVAVSLHHNHLPLLTDIDVIEYDPEANQVVAIGSIGSDDRTPS